MPYLCSSQCGHVENNVGLQILVGVANAIGEHQATLGIRVIDLHCAARVKGVNVIGAAK